MSPRPHRAGLAATTRRSFSRSALAAGALFATPPLALAAAAASTRTFGDMIGLGVKFSQGQPVSQLAALQDLGVRWVREHVAWEAIEPTPGRYREFTSAFKAQLDHYRQHGIGLVALLTLGNFSAYPPTASDPARPYHVEAFGHYAARVAHLLRAHGVRFVLEIGNEPHNTRLATTLGGAWNGRAPSPWVDRYVQLAHSAVREVKAIDPAIKLLSDEDMWIVHYWFLEAGLPRELDGFAVHPYSAPGIPERTSVAHDTDWTRPFVVVDPDRSFGSAVRRLREQGRAKLGRVPEIWVTEWGWPVAEGSERKGVSEAMVAAYLPRAFILAAAAGVSVLCWFSAWDAADGPMGLMRRDGSRRASYQAFKALTAQLGDCVLLRQAAGAKQPVSGPQAYLFNGPEGRKLVVWSADAKTRHLPLPVGAAAVDVMGRAIKPEARTSGPPTLSFGAAPIYVLAEWTDAAIDTSLAALE